MADAISDNFTTMKNSSRAWPFGGHALSAAAVWCARTLALRCALFFAREDGFWFESIRPLPGCEQRRRPDPLETLLNPPEPPFVAGLPLYGIDHGGEANAERTVWWERVNGAARLIQPSGPWVRRDDASKPLGPTHVVDKPLTKLQSKHTAIYCRIATRRDVYPLQVDDSADIMVNVRDWSRLRDIALELLHELRSSGVGAIDARKALVTLQAPMGAPLRILASWSTRTKPLTSVVGTVWWPLLVGLIPMPDLVTTRPVRATKTTSHLDQTGMLP